jgi:hypothetical protein
MMTKTDTLPLIRTKLQRPGLPGDLIRRRRLLDPSHPGLRITGMASDPEHEQSYSDVLLPADAPVCDPGHRAPASASCDADLSRVRSLQAMTSPS